MDTHTGFRDRPGNKWQEEFDEACRHGTVDDLKRLCAAHPDDIVPGRSACNIVLWNNGEALEKIKFINSKATSLSELEVALGCLAHDNFVEEMQLL